MAAPIFPKPIMPSVLPKTSIPNCSVDTVRFHWPCLVHASRYGTLRAALSNKVKARSAVVSVKTCGVLASQIFF